MLDKEIQVRMDAFRGNPQALMQRYAQSQQLMDLLALQKLKSEKEAAARQMQMQAGQGQMPTIAQQREQELLGMAKQDVADRVGQVAQQQAKQQQANLQRAAQSGIAQAPAPNMMPAQAMASGGIVAFAGPEGSLVQGEPDWIRNAPDWLKAAWRDADERGDTRALKAIQQRAAQLQQAPTAAPVRAAAPQPQGVPPATQMAGALPPPGATGVGSIALPTGRGPMPPGAPEAAPTGIGQAAPALDLRKPYEQAGISALMRKPEAEAAEAEAAYAKRVDPLFQQQQALKQQGITEAQQLAERERGMRDPLTAYLLGARGRTIGEVLGSAGRAGMEYQQQGLTRDQALAEQLQKLREAELGAQVTQEKEKYGVGEGRRKEALGEREKAMTSTGQYLTGMASADARRDIADLQAQVRAANVQTQDADRRKKLAEDAYAKDPEVESLQKQLSGVGAQMDPVKAKTLIDRMRAIQIEKYRLYELAVPETAAPAPAAAPANRPPLTSFKR